MKSAFVFWTLPFLLAALVFLGGCSPRVERVVNLLPPACSQEPEPGYCRAAIPKYFFDIGEGACQEFTWSGCGGFIPFETRQACEQACLGVEEQAQR